MNISKIGGSPIATRKPGALNLHGKVYLEAFFLCRHGSGHRSMDSRSAGGATASPTLSVLGTPEFIRISYLLHIPHQIHLRLGLHVQIGVCAVIRG